MTNTQKWAAGLGCVVLAALAAGFVLHRSSTARHGTAPIQVRPAPATPPAPPPANCLLPGPAPVPPDGNSATVADMKLGHDTIQSFVLQLEAYQACRNSQIDHAAPSVTAQQKQEWLDDGNAAIDQANGLAGEFSAQIKAFKARTPPPKQ